MTLESDHKGVESLPLKLMIVAIIASLSIMPASDALDNMRARDFLNRAELSLDRLASATRLLAIGGPGGARTVELDFSSDCSLVFERLIIGDRDHGSNMSSVVLRLTNGAVMVKTCADPAVWIRSPEGNGLVIESPRSEVKLSCHMDGGAAFILAEEI